MTASLTKTMDIKKKKHFHFCFKRHVSKDMFQKDMFKGSLRITNMGYATQTEAKDGIRETQRQEK